MGCTWFPIAHAAPMSVIASNSPASAAFFTLSTIPSFATFFCSLWESQLSLPPACPALKHRTAAAGFGRAAHSGTATRRHATPAEILSMAFL
jgi:hypothetical protein